jgi:hypothetical protein
MKFHIDSGQYPEVSKMNPGQRVTVTLVGTVSEAQNNGIILDIDSMKVGKKGKMNTQEVVLANRMKRIEDKLPGQAVVV